MKKFPFYLSMGILSGLGFSNSLNANDAKPLAIGYGALPYIAPAVGSYQLPTLGAASDGTVVDTHNQLHKLSDFFGDKVVLLSFIYATCGEVNGCPLVTSVFYKLKNRLLKEPEFAKNLRLITLSFNPIADTPAQMAHYGQGLQSPELEWQFLTTRSESELQPILQQYQQNVQKEFDKNGKFTGTFSHNLRVYLIDKNKQFRNIYSLDLLHPDLLINDIKTVFTSSNSTINSLTNLNSLHNKNYLLYQSGDDKTNYETFNYQTQSMALTQRLGTESDLLKTIEKPAIGLPPVPIPENNPITPIKIALGRKLFYDRRLSFNNTVSCAMCHIPEQGFTHREMATSVGIEGRTVRRNAPTLYNVAYFKTLFHDGRETNLEQQVWGPLLAPNEMGNPSIGFVIEKIKHNSDYQNLFEQAFAEPVNMQNIGMALASYQRSLNSANSAFDQWYYLKQKTALTLSAERGFDLFIGKAGCVNCHQINQEFALFTDQQFHNTGIGYDQSINKTTEQFKLQIAPGVFINVDSKTIRSISENKPADLGVYEISQNPQDRWKYKTPSLRNIALTAPYMHNGQFSTLEQVLAFYNQGGIKNSMLDPLLKPLGLTQIEIKDLIAFLNSLTGTNVDELVSDAFAAPIGD